MTVLAFDIATNCGVAVGDPSGHPTLWSEDLGKGRSETVRLSKMLSLTMDLVSKHQPDLIAIEAPIGGKNASSYLIKLVGVAEAAAAMSGCTVEICHSGSVRKHFVGKALTARDFPGLSAARSKAEIKRVVVKHCKMLGWHVPDHDAADAGALWQFACARFVPGYQAKVAGGLF